ncbi:MAG: chromate resistance protein [Desulfatibacillaceae bacterium]|nr:chromate resistance protein [Desulfatibacillaceae bacterium]
MRIFALLAVIACLFFAGAFCAYGQDEKAASEEVFSTWEGLEADKLASIWLIKRFIAPEAEIRFYPKGESRMDGVAFDTPYAKFRRYHNMSTFVSLALHYKVDDPAVAHLGRIIDDIEVNVWERKKFAESIPMRDATVKMIREGENTQAVVETAMEYYDSFYQGLVSKQQP